MNKLYFFYLNLLLLGHNSFAHIPSLRKLASKAILETTDFSEESKKNLNNKMGKTFEGGLGITSKAFDFTDLTIQEDLSGLNLSEATFKGCKFINANLNNTDLTDANFESASFDNTSINNIKLADEWTINNSISYIHLIQIYSGLMNAIDQYVAHKKNQNALEYYKLAQAFNQIVFKAKKIYLERVNLKNLNLKGIQLEKATLNHVNLEGSNLENANFNYSKFRNVNLRFTDLTNATFENVKSKNTQLGGAKLYKDFKLDLNLSDLEIIQQYARFMDEDKDKEAQALNRIFIHLNLNLKGKDLSNLNLKGVNFRNANLENANLTNANLINADLWKANLNDAILIGVQLSETVLLEYQQLSDLLPRWIHSRKEDKHTYQKLINAHVNIFYEGPNRDFIDFLNHRNKTEILDFTNANFTECDLQGADFRYINLSKACFYETDLRNAILIDANLTGTELTAANLRGVQLSETIVLNYNKNICELFFKWLYAKGDDKKQYQKLINTGTYIFDKPIQKNIKAFFNNRDRAIPLDLSYANFGNINLNRIDFEGINLTKAKFTSTHLAEAYLRGANLKKASIVSVDFSQADLKGTNLTDAKVIETIFIGANLLDAKLNGVQITINALNFNHQFEYNIDLEIFDYQRLSDLFPLWAKVQTQNDDWEEENKAEVWQQLINAKVNIFKGVSNEALKAFFNNRDQTILLDLSNADLSEADLRDVNFKGVILINTNFRGANLMGANMEDSQALNNYIIPYETNDETLKYYYHHTLSSEFKNSLKQILVAKGIIKNIGFQSEKRSKLQ